MFIMIGILSIDFDYFIDVSARERDLYFPDGSDEIPDDELKSMWEERYLRYPELKNVGVIDDFYFLKEYLKELNIPEENFIEADSHKSIKKTIIDKIPESCRLKIVNIDFHHDYYHFYKGKDYCNCGNWLRRVVEERPGTKVLWIRRKDSQLYSLEGIFPFEHTDDIKSILNEKFDYVFICRSPEWSPLHLINKFEELASMRLYMYNCSRIRKMI
ncbi:MAG TPA: hypothetical protein VKY40_00910 [Halanaerobiales bacterium]|jgi:hypothetical protein|nr:hypothetical protein [Halanaerobiales bacterium]